MPVTTMSSPFVACLSLLVLLATPVVHAEELVKDGWIGIGLGEGEKTHLSFGIEKDAKVVKVVTRLKVDKVSPNGLNFFAIQVNYPNKTWAHGGPQANKRDTKLVRYANWGGLVNRGGGSKDYVEADPKNDYALIECGIGKPNTVPWEWKLDQEYILTVERGKLPSCRPADTARRRISASANARCGSGSSPSCPPTRRRVAANSAP